jgi:hypothetical protein
MAKAFFMLEAARATDPPEAAAAAADLAPVVRQLVETFSQCAKTLLLNSTEEAVSSDSVRSTLATCLSVSGTKCQHVTLKLSPDSLPPGLQASLKKWNEASLLAFPTAAASSDEAHIGSLIRTHVALLSSSASTPESIRMVPLKRCLSSAAQHAADLYLSGDPATRSGLSESLFPLVLDACAENVAEMICHTLEPAKQQEQMSNRASRYAEKVFSYAGLCVAYRILVRNISFTRL